MSATKTKPSDATRKERARRQALIRRGERVKAWLAEWRQLDEEWGRATAGWRDAHAVSKGINPNYEIPDGRLVPGVDEACEMLAEHGEIERTETDNGWVFYRAVA